MKQNLSMTGGAEGDAQPNQEPGIPSTKKPFLLVRRLEEAQAQQRIVVMDCQVNVEWKESKEVEGGRWRRSKYL
jgi:hypothetical protein